MLNEVNHSHEQCAHTHTVNPHTISGSQNLRPAIPQEAIQSVAGYTLDTLNRLQVIHELITSIEGALLGPHSDKSPEPAQPCGLKDQAAKVSELAETAYYRLQEIGKKLFEV